MSRKSIVGSLCCLLLMAFVANSQESLSRSEIEKRVVGLIAETVAEGAKVFNDGNPEGCYRIYQGSLMAAGKLLDHRPELVKLINEKLTKAKTQASPADRAFTLREALDGTYKGLTTKALWDRLGGEKAVEAVVHDFVIAAATNPKVNFFRDGKFKFSADEVKKLERLLVEFISANTGGPMKYTGRDMKSSHVGMKITEAEFGAIAGDLIDTLKKYKVPQKEIDELVTIVASTKPDIVDKDAPKKEVPVKDKVLWERLGGEPAVRAVVHDFVIAAATNPKVNFFRDGKFKLNGDDVKKLEQLLVELVSAVSGGPLKYTGRSMKDSHKGMKITEAEFGAIAGDLIATLKKFKVPQKEIDELVGIIATTKDDIVEKEEPKKELPKKEPPVKEKALWDRLGGEKAVAAVVHDFVIAAATNQKVNFFRDGKFKFTEKDVEKLESQLVELISAVSGGPLKYTGRSMKDSHKGMKITEEEFNAMAGDLIDTLKKYKVPQKEIDELVGIVASTKDDIVEVKNKKE